MNSKTCTMALITQREKTRFRCDGNIPEESSNNLILFILNYLNNAVISQLNTKFDDFKTRNHTSSCHKNY